MTGGRHLSASSRTSIAFLCVSRKKAGMVKTSYAFLASINVPPITVIETEWVGIIGKVFTRKHDGSFKYYCRIINSPNDDSNYFRTLGRFLFLLLSLFLSFFFSFYSYFFVIVYFYGRNSIVSEQYPTSLNLHE